MKNGPKCHAEPFACHSERSEESLSFHAQGRLRDASLYFLENKYRGPSLRSGRQAGIAFFISLLELLGSFPSLRRHLFVCAQLEQRVHGGFNDVGRVRRPKRLRQYILN